MGDHVAAPNAGRQLDCAPGSRGEVAPGQQATS